MLSALKTVSQKIVSDGSQKVGQTIGLWSGAFAGGIYAGSLMTREYPGNKKSFWSFENFVIGVGIPTMGAMAGSVLGTVWFISIPLGIGVGYVDYQTSRIEKTLQ